MTEGSDVFAVAESMRGQLHRYFRSKRLPPDVEAHDLVQTTLVKVWQNRHRYRKGSPPKPWIQRIATNVWIDEIRRVQKFTPHLRDGHRRDSKFCTVLPIDTMTSLLDLRQQLEERYSPIADVLIRHLAGYTTRPQCLEELSQRGQPLNLSALATIKRDTRRYHEHQCSIPQWDEGSVEEPNPV